MLGIGTASALLAGAKLAKALAFAKGLTGIGAKVVGPKLGAQVAGQAARTAATKFAGGALAKAGTMVPKSVGEATKMIVGKDLYNNQGQLITRLAPDALFGVIAGGMTEGDIGDKLIAGTASAAGGGLGGIALGRVGQRLGGNTGGFLADIGGSIAGDMVGMKVADDLMRFKGGGFTPYERQMMQQDAVYRAQLEQEFLNKYGYMPTIDPVSAANGQIA
jgi:hypothetical protein